MMGPVLLVSLLLLQSLVPLLLPMMPSLTPVICHLPGEPFVVLATIKPSYSLMAVPSDSTPPPHLLMSLPLLQDISSYMQHIFSIVHTPLTCTIRFLSSDDDSNYQLSGHITHGNGSRCPQSLASYWAQ